MATEGVSYGRTRMVCGVTLTDGDLDALAERLAERPPSPELTLRPLVDADAVAAMLGLDSKRRVYELTRLAQDPLPGVRIGGALRFLPADVEAWVTRQATTSASPRPSARRTRPTPSRRPSRGA
jgi:hypothetical protein